MGAFAASMLLLAAATTPPHMNPATWTMPELRQELSFNFKTVIYNPIASFQREAVACGDIAGAARAQARLLTVAASVSPDTKLAQLKLEGAQSRMGVSNPAAKCDRAILAERRKSAFDALDWVERVATELHKRNR